MDGEFDREINDDGWGPIVGSWKPLQIQLNNTLRAAEAVCDKKGRDKKLGEIREKVEQLVRQKGKKMEEQGPLGAWLWEKVKECEVKVAELVEQEKQANMLQKSKLKKKAELQDEERRGWSELAVLWQSVRHLHHETGLKKGSQVVNAPDTPACPPPYAPPATPTPGIYPTLYVTGGTLQEGEDEDVGAVDSASSIQPHTEVRPHSTHSPAGESLAGASERSGCKGKQNDAPSMNGEYAPVSGQAAEEWGNQVTRILETRNGEIDQRRRRVAKIARIVSREGAEGA